MSKRSAPRIVIGATVALLLAGCVGTKSYRQPVGAEPNPESIAPNASLHFVEFDDEGWPYDRAQLQSMTDAIESHDHCARPALIVTFAHGWKHNSARDNANVTEVKEQLALLAKMHSDRQVFAVYLGWRGLSIDFLPLHVTTFWSRKAAATRVGTTGAPEVFGELERLKGEINASLSSCSPKQAVRPYLVNIGHSFGALLTYNAYQGSLPSRMRRMSTMPDEDARNAFMSDKTDMIVLLNAAIEAARFEPIANIPAGCGGRCQTMLLSATAKSDTSTRRFFPIGQFFGELSRNIDQRSDTTVNQTGSSRRTIGHFKPWVTHNLKSTAKGTEAALKQRAEAMTRQCATPQGGPRDTGAMGPDVDRFCLYELSPREGTKLTNPRVVNLQADNSTLRKHGLDGNLKPLMYFVLDYLAYMESQGASQE